MAITKNLLLHWWHYYGKMMYTLEELEQFEKIIDEYGVERTFDVAIASFVVSDGSPTPILNSIRLNKVSELFDSVPKDSDFTPDEKEAYESIRKGFLEEISKTTH